MITVNQKRIVFSYVCDNLGAVNLNPAHFKLYAVLAVPRELANFFLEQFSAFNVAGQLIGDGVGRQLNVLCLDLLGETFVLLGKLGFCLLLAFVQFLKLAFLFGAGLFGQ
ncbi:hypothetical protein D3C86_1909730 [compost metagenome]